MLSRVARKPIRCNLTNVSLTNPAARQRNPRGQGGQLRTEIVRAAGELLDQEGTAQAVTLRAVARRIGISAPSIYAHFADRDEILLAVVQDAFEVLTSTLVEARDGAEPDPLDRLQAVCKAYLQFALDSPQRYRVMFGGQWNAEQAAARSDKVAEAARSGLGLNAFAVLAELCGSLIEQRRSHPSDPHTTATALWVTLHGYAGLQSAAPLFPWPENFLATLEERALLLTD